MVSFKHIGRFFAIPRLYDVHQIQSTVAAFAAVRTAARLDPAGPWMAWPWHGPDDSDDHV